jgi:hypothetical protein
MDRLLARIETLEQHLEALTQQTTPSFLLGFSWGYQTSAMDIAVILTVTALLAGCASTPKWESSGAPVEKAFAACKAEGRVSEGLSVQPSGNGYRILGGPAGRDELERCMLDKLR